MDVAAHSSRLWLGAILALALILRGGTAIGVQWSLRDQPQRLCLIAGDAEGYWELARKIAHGDDFAIYDPPRYVLRMPGFPLILAVAQRVIGENLWLMRLWLALWGVLGVYLVHQLAWLLTKDSTVSLLSAGLAALSPAWIGFSVLILSETCFAVSLLLSLISLVWVMQLEPTKLGIKACVLAGLSAALACYIRPSWLLFPACYGLWEAVVRKNPKAATLRTSLILVGLFLGLGPWIVRNYMVTGHFVPTTLWMGPSLYDGLNPQANGDSHMESLEIERAYQVMSEYEVDQYFRKQAWQFVRENPVQTLKLAWIKLGRFWNLWPNSSQFDGWAARLLLASFFLPVLICAVYGGWLMMVRGQPTSCGTPMMRLFESSPLPGSAILFCTGGPILYFCLLHLLFVSSLRYRLPTEYPLFILSAVGIRGLITKLTTPESKVTLTGSFP